MRARIGAVLVVFIGLFVPLFLFVDNTMAAQEFGWIGSDTSTGGSGNGGGGGSCSGSDDYWREDCAGASWIFYEESSWLKANKDKLLGDSIELKFPLSDLYNKRNNFTFSLPVSECVSGQDGSGFWHYGLNGYGKSSSYGGFYWFASGFSNIKNDPTANAWRSNYYSVPANKWGHWESYSSGVIEWIPEIVSNNVEQTLYGMTQDGWQPLYVANSSTKMQQYVGYQVQTVSMTGSKRSYDTSLLAAYNAVDSLYGGSGNYPRVPVGTYAFCYHLIPSGTEGWVQFKAGSKVETNGTERRKTYDTDDLSGVDKTESPASGVYDETVQVGEAVSIVFKHYATSAKASGSQGYKYEITRTGFDAANVSINSVNGNGPGEYTRIFNSQYENVYVANDSPSEARKRVEKNTYSIQFDAAGEYVLCEQIKFPTEYSVVGASNIPNAVTSKVCTRIKVNAGSNVHESQSTVLVSDDGITADTGIVSANSTKETATISKDVGDTVTVSFAHRGFASLSEKKVSYTVSGTPTAGTGYTITRGGGLNLGDNITGKANLTSRYDTLRFSTSSATASDFFQITFTAAGTYSFCESFAINSITTKVCAKFSVRSSGKSVGVSQITGGGSTKNTGIVTSDMNAVSKTLDLGVFDPGTTVSFSFQHWGGINPKGKGSWTVEAAMVYSPGGFTGGSWVGTDGHPNVTMKTLYMNYGGTKYYSSSSGGLLTGSNSNSYSYRVYNEGSYKFCQKLYVNGGQKTEVCATWSVRPGPRDGCSSNPNITKVDSYVKNDSTGSQGSVIYAKPNDTVTWHECYYAGVQQYADVYVTVTHAEPSHPLWPNTDPSTNTNKKFKDAITWGNSYAVSYPDGATGGNTYAAGSIVDNNSISHSMLIKPGHVGYTESTLKDYIKSSTPIAASTHNYGVHSWECMPSTTNGGGNPSKYDWISYSPKRYKDVCDGTEGYVCPGGWNGPNSSNTCYRTVDDYTSASSSLAYGCPQGWDGPDSDHNCSRTVDVTIGAATPSIGYGCPEGWSGPDSNHNCSKTVTTIAGMAEEVSGYTCPAEGGWTGPNRRHKCTKTTTTVHGFATPSTTYSCPDGWDGPNSRNKCTKTTTSRNVIRSRTQPTNCSGTLTQLTTTIWVCTTTSTETTSATETTTYSCSVGDLVVSNNIHTCQSSSTETIDATYSSYYTCSTGTHYEIGSLHYCMTTSTATTPATSTTTYSCAVGSYAVVNGRHVCQKPQTQTNPATTTTVYSCTTGSGPYTINGSHKCLTGSHQETTPASQRCFNSAGTDIGYRQEEILQYAPVEWYKNPKCKHTNDYVTYSYTTGPSTATSGVRVPYNYKLTATVDAGTGVVYSGETMSLNKGAVNVETKYNAATSGTYATVAKDVKTKLIAFVSSYNMTGGAGVVGSNDLCGMVGGKQCTTLAENTGQTFNSSGVVSGSFDNTVYSGSWNAFDAKAGDYVCFMMAVYPATSGSDTNMGDFDGDGMWYRSNASCKQIAKKPTFQVWGGGLFSGGNVTSSVSEKRNLYPLYPDNFPAYQKSGSANSKLFGSWVEQNLTLVGTTGTVASGSALAGGSTHVGATDFCRYRAPLSFANYSSVGCPSVQKAGSMGLSSVSSLGAVSNRSIYIDYWLGSVPAANIAAGSSINLSVNYDSMQSASGVAVRYSVANGNVRLAGTSIDKSVTHIVKASAGDVYIDGNIYYNANGLTNINQVPKLIIYGRNVYIACSVTEVDAIIIADGVIDTCKDGGGDSASTRSNQLYIRGMTISNTLTLGRTYGAATGVYSDVPAEIINYDSSAILWGKHMAGVGESNTMTMTYTREIAPRY